MSPQEQMMALFQQMMASQAVSPQGVTVATPAPVPSVPRFGTGPTQGPIVPPTPAANPQYEKAVTENAGVTAKGSRKFYDIPSIDNGLLSLPCEETPCEVGPHRYECTGPLFDLQGNRLDADRIIRECRIQNPNDRYSGWSLPEFCAFLKRFAEDSAFFDSWSKIIERCAPLAARISRDSQGKRKATFRP